MKRDGSWWLMVLVLFGSSCLIGYLAYSKTQAGSRLKPFVAYEREHMLGSQGELRLAVERVVAHREDGSYALRFTTTSPLGEKDWHAEFFDASTRREVWLEVFTRSVMTIFLSDTEVANRVASQMRCANSEIRSQLAQKTIKSSKILDREVLGVTRKLGGDVSWSWVAPDLDCYPLSEILSSARGSRNVTWVERVDVGTPPQTLFDVPSDYTERSPMEIEAAYKAKYPGHALFGEKSVAVLEQRYSRNRR